MSHAEEVERLCGRIEELETLNAELLEALKNFSNGAMPSDPWSPEWLRSVDTLIAKAEGKCEK